MDDDRIGGSLRPVMIRTMLETKKRGGSTVEAEDILLAVAANPRSPTAQILAESGLTYDGIAAALAIERERSLAVVGVGVFDESRLTASPNDGRPSWGASAKEAFTTHGSSPIHRTDESGLVAGILRAQLGTVPRALDLAGIDRDALIEQLAALSVPRQ